MKILRLDLPLHWDRDPISEDDIVMPVRIGRPGWYGDRLRRESWVELRNGEAYLESWKQFSYTLKLARHRVLHPREREAILELQRMGSCPRALSELLQFDTEANQIRQSYRETRKFMMKWD